MSLFNVFKERNAINVSNVVLWLFKDAWVSAQTLVDIFSSVLCHSRYKLDDKILNLYIKTWFCICPSAWDFNSNVVFHSKLIHFRSEEILLFCITNKMQVTYHYSEQWFKVLLRRPLKALFSINFFLQFNRCDAWTLYLSR